MRESARTLKQKIPVYQTKKLRRLILFVFEYQQIKAQYNNQWVKGKEKNI